MALLKNPLSMDTFWKGFRDSCLIWLVIDWYASRSARLPCGGSDNGIYLIGWQNDMDKRNSKKDQVGMMQAYWSFFYIHELVTEEYLSKILWELNEEHKELLFLCAVRLFSSIRIAKIRNQIDRNIRKVRNTMLKKIRKKLLPALLDKAEKQQPMTLLEKDFLEENMTKIDSKEKKSYNG